MYPCCYENWMATLALKARLRLQRYMDQYGWSVRDLSYEARVPYTTVKRLSEHAVSQIHIPTITALARALGCDWMELVELVDVDDETDPPEPQVLQQEF